MRPSLFEKAQDRPAFVCAKGCGRPVKGIYCPEHRDQVSRERAAARAEAARARSEAMKARWKNREEMLALIAAGKAPAEEDDDA